MDEHYVLSNAKQVFLSIGNTSWGENKELERGGNQRYYIQVSSLNSSRQPKRVNQSLKHLNT